ncbi:hypothetical protein DFH07DRAFT_780606 [Mycena maculata]|uniref:Kinesin light chain n=1 Tax=Mycena maculata TaxID=230809 RepID=A0AAD7I268_9AGAR|nr:hypothetical protein DFH07DRAFT_780606 [Mycena maculata]
MPPTTATPAPSAPTVVAPGGPSASNTPSQPTDLASGSDWLPYLNIIKDGAEAIPFPYVKAAFGVVATLLETVKKVKENRGNLKEVCTSALEIMQHVNNAIAFHGDVMAVRFKHLCNGFIGLLKEIQERVEKWNKQRIGVRGRVREFIKADNMGAEISQYKERIKELQANFMMVGMIDANVGLTKVDEQITKLNEKLSDVVSDQLVPPLKGCPFPSPIFHGRRKVLDPMHTYFGENLGSRHVYVLYGLGGAGKTQTALKFVEESSVFHQYQYTKHHRYDPTMQFIPGCTHGNILITTRNPELCLHAPGPDSQHRLSEMEEADAMELLLRSSQNESTSENMRVACGIVQALHKSPLAVVQAGAFIHKHQCLKDYLDLYKTNKSRLLKEQPTQTHDDYAWTLQPVGPTCSATVAALFFLHHEGITESMFSLAVLYDGIVLGELAPTAEDLSDSQKFLAQFLTSSRTWDHLSFTKVITEIHGSSLMEPDSHKETYSIHPLVQDWTQINLTDSHCDRKCIVALIGMALIGMSVPLGNQLDHHQFRIQLLPHLDSLLSNPIAEENDLKFQFTFGRVYQVQGRLVEAQPLLSKHAVKARRQLGDDHPESLTAILLLAGVISEAAELQVMVLEKRKQLLGPDHPDTLCAMGNLAVSYSDLGQWKGAADLQVVVFEKIRQLVGEGHLYTLHTMGNLATSYRHLGQTQEAEELEVVVLEKRKQLIGEEHPDTLLAMGNLAASYRDMGQSKEAEDLETVVLEMRKCLLGEDHSRTLVAMANLACSYRDMGRSQEAVNLETIVLEKRKQLLGEDHPHTLLAMGNLAASYKAVGGLQEAVGFETIVLEKRKQLLGEGHPHTLLAMGNLAVSYKALGRLQEAVDLETIVLEKRKRLLSESHPHTLLAMGNLAASYKALGRLQEAVDLKTIVLEKRKQLLGAEHPHTLLAMHNLATSYHDMGCSMEVAELEATALEIENGSCNKKRKRKPRKGVEVLLALESIAGEALRVTHKCQDLSGVGFHRKQSSEGEACGAESHDEGEGFATESGAQKEEVGDSLGDKALRTVGGEGEVEVVEKCVESDVCHAQLRQNTALRAPQHARNAWAPAAMAATLLSGRGPSSSGMREVRGEEVPQAAASFPAIPTWAGMKWMRRRRVVHAQRRREGAVPAGFWVTKLTTIGKGLVSHL